MPKREKTTGQQGKVPAVRAYFIPGRGIMSHLRPMPPHQTSPVLSRQGSAANIPLLVHPQHLAGSCWWVCYLQWVFQAVSLLRFLSETSTIMISTCFTLIQPTAMLSPRRQGVASGAPLAHGARRTHSHPGCPSFLPSQPMGAHFKRPQWPQQQVYSQTCRPCHLPQFH